MFEAYEPEVVVDQLGKKIECLCPWNKAVIAGLSDGSLLFFEEQPVEQRQSAGGTLSPWQVTRVKKGFAKRAVLQLLVLEEDGLMLSLTGK
jgi:hypothetical protein